MGISDVFQELAERISEIEQEGYEVNAVRAGSKNDDGGVDVELSVDIPIADQLRLEDADVRIRELEPIDDANASMRLTVEFPETDTGVESPKDAGGERPPAEKGNDRSDPGGEKRGPDDGGDDQVESDQGPDQDSQRTAGVAEAAETAPPDDTNGDETGGARTDAPEAEQPAYRDPERLRTVYENHDTFAAMTDALDVDVTPQTVRKYMIRHDIHEVSNDSDEGDTEDASGETTRERDDVDGADAESDETNGGDTSETQSHRGTAPDRAGPGHDGTADTRDDAIDDGTLDETDRDQDLRGRIEAVASRAISDDEELPDDLEAEEFVAAIRQARTLYDLQRTLDLDRERTRALLDRLNLLDLVHGRVSRIDEEPSTEEVHERIAAATTDAD